MIAAARRRASDVARGRGRRRRLHRRRAVDRLLRAEHRLAQRAAPRARSTARLGPADHDRQRRQRRRLGGVPLRRGPRRVSDMVMLTIGTGVGGAVVAERPAAPRRLRRRRRARPHARRPRRPAVRLRRARMHRAVRLRPRAAAHGERDRRRRRHRPGPRRGARGERRRARRHDRRRAHRRPATRAPCARSARARLAGSARRARRFGAVLDPQLFVFGGGVAQRRRAAARPDPRGVPRPPAGARLPPRAASSRSPSWSTTPAWSAPPTSRAHRTPRATVR